MNYLKYYLSVIPVFLCLVATSPSFRNNAFHSVGWASITDVFQGPAIQTIVEDGRDIDTLYNRYNGFSIFTLIYNFRYNIHEQSDDLAYSISIIPAVGAPRNEDATYVSLNIPILLNVEFGAGATYGTRANFGGFLAAGAEYFNGQVFPDRSPRREETEAWIQPVISGGVRFWDKKNRLMEVNLKYGTSGTQPYGRSQGSESRSGTLRLGFLWYLNY